MYLFMFFFCKSYNYNFFYTNKQVNTSRDRERPYLKRKNRFLQLWNMMKKDLCTHGKTENPFELYIQSAPVKPPPPS